MNALFEWKTSEWESFVVGYWRRKRPVFFQQELPGAILTVLEFTSFPQRRVFPITLAIHLFLPLILSPWLLCLQLKVVFMT